MVNRKLSIVAMASVFGGILATVPVFANTSTSGNVKVEMELTTAIAMKITSPNDVNPDCTAESGTTYGTANRYASSTGDNSGKMVDTFDGREGQADEINTNTSCTTLSMSPNTFDSAYSDVTVYTNSPTGYALTVQSAENVSPNLVNTADSTQYIEAGTLTENNGTVPGGQNKWAYKTDGNLITDWTAVTTSPAAIKSYATYTEGGDTTRVTYGVSTGSNPTGKYTTTLTYTATMFDDLNPYMNYMQDFNADDHISDATGTEYTVFDSRDNKQYTAKKLADGNIWMMENLELDLPEGQSTRTLTPADSDVSANWTLEDNSDGAPGWCNTGGATCDNQKLISKAGYSDGTYTAPTYYYNWYTATAGTGTYDTGLGNVSDSICPKGWTLPTDAQAIALDQAYGGSGDNRTDATQITNFMNNVGLGLTGYRDANEVAPPTEVGYYWLRSAYSEAYAYALSFNLVNGRFWPKHLNAKFYGFAVRCVAKTPSMQGFSASAHASDAVGTIYDLEDSRDGQKYTAAKLADNNIWMTKDLKLDGGRTLTSADSDVTTSFYLLDENTGTWCTEDSAACDNQSLMIKTGVPNGYLYNWYAATAGTGTYSTGANQNATASICPKGWKLPTGGGTSEARSLLAAYGENGSGGSNPTAVANLMTTPIPAFDWTGYREGGSTSRSTYATRYHSRTVNSSLSAGTYVMGFDGDSFYSFDSVHRKWYGFAIRCIAAS